MREQILSFIRSKGPVLPVEVAQLLKSNILLASAYLSEMVSNGTLKISNVKVGGSPLYYMPGQERMLEKYISKLHEKEQRAVLELKQKKVLKDSELEPVVRVGLRNARDFAKPVEVLINNQKQLFWRWFLTPKSEVESIIRERYLKKPVAERTPQVESKGAGGETKEQKKIPEQTVKEDVKRVSFKDKVLEFFDEHNIKIRQQEEVKKNKHYWFIIEVPASIGYITYYCEAKSKKTITPSDLSDALVKAQTRRLPLLYISNGKSSKSLQEMMDNEFKNIILKEI